MAASTGKVTFQPRVNLNDVEDQTRVDEADFPPAAERPYVPAEEE